MKNLFVPYEIAKQLKEKGFDEPCICVYKKGVKKTVYPVLSNEPSYPFKTVKNTQTGSLHFSSPLYQQVIDWFEEKHNIIILLHFVMGVNTFEFWIKTSDDKIIFDLYHELENKDKYIVLRTAFEKALKLIP